MKAVLRPAFVLGLSIAIAATSLIGSSVALAAVRPLITSWSLSGPVYEGDRPSVNATFTDADLTDLHTVDIAWGDDTYDSYTLPVGDRSFSLQKTVAYVNDRPDTLTLLLTVSDAMSSNTKTLPVIVLNAAPSFTSFRLSATDLEAGQAVTATGAFTDGGANDTHTVTLNWGDLTPTTTMAAVGSFTSDHTYTAVGDFTVTATVTDDAGATAVATSTVSVRTPNQAPSIVSFDVTVGSEGGSSALALAFADVDASDTHTVSVAWGDGQTTDSGTLAATVTTFEATHVYADTGNYPLVLTLTDSATPAHTVTTSWSVSPTNVDPVLGTLSVSPSPVVDHQELTLSGSFTDPGTADTFTLTVNWGAGALPPQPLGTARSFSVTHVYDAAGPVTITVTVEDRDGGRSTSSVDLVVLPSNHAPANLTLDPSVTGANVLVDASFTDLDAGDTHLVTMGWGDGASTTQFLAAGTTTFAASHVYEASDTYTVTATVSDPAGASTSAGVQVVVTVAADSASDVLDAMSTLVQSFELDRNPERWLLKKLDDVKDSLAYGNNQVCSSTGTLSHIMFFAERNLTLDQYAALSALATKLEAAAGCTSDWSQHPKVQRAATVTTTVTTVLTTTVTPALTLKKDTTTKTTTTTTTTTKTAGGRSSH